MFSREKTPLAVSTALRFFYVIGTATVLQLYMEQLGATPFQISLIEVAFWITIILFAPLWGAISDVTGNRRGIIIASIAVTSALIPVYGYLMGFQHVIGWRLIVSTFSAAFAPIALAWTSEFGGSAERGRNMSVYTSTRSTGFALGRIGAGLLLTYLAFSDTFWVLGGIGMLALVASLFIEDHEEPEKDWNIKEVLHEAYTRLVPTQNWSLFKQNGYRFLLTGIFLRKAAIIGMFSLIAVYIVSVKGLSTGVMGLLMALNPAVQVPFMLLFGRLVDKVGRQKVFSFGFLLSIGVPLILAYADGPFLFILAFSLLGFSFAALAAGSTAFIGDIAPDHMQAELLGFRKTAQGVAGVVGGLTGGIAASTIGFQGMFFLMAGIMVAAFFVAWLGTTETLHS